MAVPQIGTIRKLKNLGVDVLNGFKIEIVAVNEDDEGEGETIDVKLLEAPEKTAWKVGDLITVRRFELTDI